MGIFDVIKKNIFSVSFENKIMKTISRPIFIKDFNKESENIIELNQLLNNTNDNEMKKKVENEFTSIKGFGEVKFEKYGEDIINIIKSIIK